MPVVPPWLADIFFRCYLFFKCWGELASESTWDWRLPFQKTLYYKFYFLKQLWCCLGYLFHLGWVLVVIFNEFPFHLKIWNLFVEFFHCHFHVCGVCSGGIFSSSCYLYLPIFIGQVWSCPLFCVDVGYSKQVL